MMRIRVLINPEPGHFAPIGQVHHPRRCVLCWVTRIGLWLGVIDFYEPLPEPQEGSE